MSGHSKWHSIKHKKGAADAKRGKVFTKHAQLISLAARGGSDPGMNPSLRSAIDDAKAANVPNSNIDRAIKKGSGQDKDAAQIMEVFYEGYGPEGTAIYIHTITDNKNRSLSNVKTIMGKNGGNLGATGCVSYMFDRKGFILIDSTGSDADEIELMAIEHGAEDTKRDGDMIEVYSSPTAFAQLKTALEGEGYKIDQAEVTFVPQNTVDITEEGPAKKILSLIEKLEDDDDVVNVYSNFDVPSEVLERLG